MPSTQLLPSRLPELLMQTAEALETSAKLVDREAERAERRGDLEVAAAARGRAARARALGERARIEFDHWL
jgi:hypothetical protein